MNHDHIIIVVHINPLSIANNVDLHILGSPNTNDTLLSLSLHHLLRAFTAHLVQLHRVTPRTLVIVACVEVVADLRLSASFQPYTKRIYKREHFIIHLHDVHHSPPRIDG